ncbi:MAG: ribonuclease J [Candidatus Verstraetearchaeota archaeon]|nr:ribonuclease J [Candidatus Verstraetearchaeota archaeon]
MTIITVYDGGDTIGGNKILVEEGEEGVFLDFGLNFSKYSEYFSEFLTDRRGRGIHDLIHLDLIPKLDVYRPDLTPSDLHTFAFYRPSLKAVLLSHIHLDHSGNLGLLRMDLPVVASPESVALLKAMRDLGPTTLGCETAYTSRRRYADSEGLTLHSDHASPFVCRDFFCTEDPPSTLIDFASTIPRGGEGRKPLEPGTLGRLEALELPFEVKAAAVDHSVCGACGYILLGESPVAYTGDLRAHGKNSHKTWEFAKEARHAGTLIIEGTCAGRGKEGCTTEEEVQENCLAAVEEEEGLVIADFSGNNFERLETFLWIAEKTGRELVLTKKDAYMLRALTCSGHIAWCEKEKRLSVYKDLKGAPAKRWEEVTLDDWKGKTVGFRELRADPGGHILCFSFYDLKNLLDIRPEGGIYIYSSCEAHSEEEAIDFIRLSRWLRLFDLKIHGFRIEVSGGKEFPVFEQGYHASGHATEGDLERIIDIIDPDLLIPVHTECPEWFIGKARKVALPAKGERIVL